MTQYFGFDPGTYQPWAINLQMDVLGQPGVARGMQVQQIATPSMNVQLSVDAIAGDGVVYLPNGGWARIDAVASLSVPSNSSGNLRTDAVVVYVDPTGISTSNIGYITGWGTGFKGTNNQQVLALVNVPNNASSVVNGNIINNPLNASAGTNPPNFPDGPVNSEKVDPHGCPPGIFEAIEVLVSSNATNNQTQWSIPLTNYQRLVPQGRIGGALETGFFAGPNGWYWPKVRGTTSGLLPVTSVDPVNGNINTAGAQAGESIYVSFRYYDFSRDVRVRTGTMFIEKNSPYIVYQGEVVEDKTLGQQYPLWDGPTGTYLLLNPGESYWYIDYSSNIEFLLFGGPGGTNNTINTFINGTPAYVNNTFSATGAPSGQQYRAEWGNMYPSNGLTVNVYQIKLSGGMMAIPGIRNFITSGQGVVVSGGVVNVQGQPVLLQSTSFNLPAPNSGVQDSYVIYTDKYGNISSSGTTLAIGEDRILGRVPVAAALQYGSPPGTGTVILSSGFGQWALPGSYLGMPTQLVVTGNGTAGVGTSLANGWVFQQDTLSPNGGYLVANNQWDTFYAQAVCTGMDLLLHTTGVTSAFQVWVDNPNVNTPVSSKVLLAGTTQYNVRVTLFSGLPYGSHTVKLNNLTTAGQWGLDAVDVRVPATPAAPSGTVPLAQVDTFGFSCLIRPSIVRGAKVCDFNNTSTLILDAFRPSAEPAIWMSNNTSGNDLFVMALKSTGGFILHYQAGPNQGIISLKNYSVDTYSVNPVIDTSTLVFTGGSIDSVDLSSAGFKNASSGGWGVIINAIDTFPPSNFVTDLRRFGVGHGYASELRASSLQTHLGGRLDDGGQGIRADQIRDRGIPSRKLAPTNAYAVTTTPWSGSPGTDPNIAVKIAVEVPSLLLINWAASPIIAASSAVGINVLVDGFTISPHFNFQAPGATAQHITFGGTVLPYVAAGTHLIQLSMGNDGQSVQPYFDGNSERSLAVIAFAL